MPDFWQSCGYNLLKRQGDGRLAGLARDLLASGDELPIEHLVVLER